MLRWTHHHNEDQYWILGLVFLSQAALLAAMFNHLYIWVHYYSTEKPDMRLIYGKD